MQNQIVTVVLLAAMQLGSSHAALAQSAIRPVDSTATTSGQAPALAGRSWFASGDGRKIAFGAASVVLSSALDEPLGQRLQRQSLQRNTSLKNFANTVEAVGDPGALLLSASMYVGARLTGHQTVADAARHTLEGIAASAVVTQTFKYGVGRERPNLSNTQNAFVFHPARGYQTDHNSFPSGHTTAAFAAATVFSMELQRAHPRAARVVTPALYTVATLVGGARMFNNRHWFSDVAAGAFIGTFTGRRIVQHAHPE